MQRHISNGSGVTVTDEQHQCRSRPRPLMMNRAGSVRPRPAIHQLRSVKRRPSLMNHASVTVALTRPLLMYPLLSVTVTQFPTATDEYRGLNTKNRAAPGRAARRNGLAAAPSSPTTTKRCPTAPWPSSSDLRPRSFPLPPDLSRRSPISLRSYPISNF